MEKFAELLDNFLRISIISNLHDAGIAQLVERNLAKVEVESSRLFSRSRFLKGSSKSFPFFIPQEVSWRSAYDRLHCLHESDLAVTIRTSGGVAKWLCSGLQSRIRRFDSGLRLQNSYGFPSGSRFYFREMANKFFSHFSPPPFLPTSFRALLPSHRLLALSASFYPVFPAVFSRLSIFLSL